MKTLCLLETIKSPSVIACRQYEQFIKLEHFKTLAALIPNAKLIILPDVSHGSPLQDPVRFHIPLMDLLNNK